MDEGNVVEVYKLTKRFKTLESRAGEKGFMTSIRRRRTEKVALDEVSFTVKRGSFVALLGKNGAGKSTLVKILAGIIKPDSGQVNVLGLDPYKDRIRLAKKIGVVLGAHEQMWWDLPGIDTFILMQRLYEIPKSAFEERLRYYIKVFSLEKVYKKQVRQMSLGERMKCNFIASILHRPELVILDEPTIGMDQQSKASLFKALLQIKKRYGITFILSTNLVDEADILADTVVLLDEGKVLFEGLQEELAKDIVIPKKYRTEPSLSEILDQFYGSVGKKKHMKV